MEARQIPGTTKIICTMTGHNGPTRGAIGVVDRSKGMNAQEAIVNVTPDTPVPNVDQGCGNTDGSKLYSCPLPLDGTRFLLSARGPVLVRDLAGTCVSVVLPRPADGMQYFNATPVRTRTRPPVIASRPTNPDQVPMATRPRFDFPVVGDPDAANDPYAVGSGIATLYLQDVYNGLEPFVQRGEVKTIRVVREIQKTVRIDPSLRAFGFQFPVISCGATYAGKYVIGEVDVNPDGSAYFNVPAGTPLYFMALDAQGRAVQRMRTFTHLMAGETQGCVGCHEPRLDSPRSQLPAYGQQPQRLRAPEWGIGGFDYSRVVQPVLDKHCTDCHNATEAPKGIDLSGDKTDFFNVSYDVLAREKQGGKGSPLVNWIPTYNGQEWNILHVAPKEWGSCQSKLADVILSGHPDQDGKPRVKLNDAERRRILAWIDLNVPYYGTSETSHPELPGCRQVYPKDLDKVLADVGQRRCAECHAGGKFPRREWTRVTHPELNAFLLAPLAKAEGGTEKLRPGRVPRHAGPRLPGDPADVPARAGDAGRPAPNRHAGRKGFQRGEPVLPVALRFRGVCQLEQNALTHGRGIPGERIHGKVHPLGAFQLGKRRAVDSCQTLDIAEAQPLRLAHLPQLREHFRGVAKLPQPSLRPNPQIRQLVGHQLADLPVLGRLLFGKVAVTSDFFDLPCHVSLPSRRR